MNERFIVICNFLITFLLNCVYFGFSLFVVLLDTYRVTHGSRTFFKKKILGGYSTWNGFICTKIKVKTCHLL